MGIGGNSWDIGTDLVSSCKCYKKEQTPVKMPTPF